MVMESKPLYPDEQGRPFRVTDLASAAWAMRKVRRVRERQKEIRDFGKAELEKIATWMAEETERLDKSVEHLEELLTYWHREELEKDDRRKTIRLPGGELTARKQPDQWVIDTEAFIPWAEAEHPELIRVKKEVDERAAKRLLDTSTDKPVDPETGEIAPGVEIESRGVKFSVKVQLDD